MSEKANVIPIRRADKFEVKTGKLHQDGSIEELYRVGTAYVKPGSKTFRVKFWMFPKESFFVSRDNNSDSTYTILSLEEFLSESQESKTLWREVGKGFVMGNYIRLEFYLISQEIYLSLFPTSQEATGELNAS